MEERDTDLEQRRELITIISELSTNYSYGVPEEEVLKRAEEKGLREASELLYKMMVKGEVYCPKENCYEATLPPHLLY